MKKRTIGFTFLFILFLSIQVEAQTTDKKTLHRWPDPVIINGNLLDVMEGMPISSLRLYAYKNGSMLPIRFQIDEMTPDGDWVLPEGPKSNAKLGTSTFAKRDVLVFMVDDTGNKAPKEKWIAGHEKALEIEVTDPLDNTKSWCYLFSFPENPPPPISTPYIHYTSTDKEDFVESEYYRADYIITPDGLHSTYYKNLMMPPSAGGNNENFADRLKIRLKVKLLFSAIPINLDEENLKSNVLAWKEGPVRIIKRVEQYVKGPFGIKMLRAIVDVQYYRNVATVPVRFYAPFKLNNLVSSFIIRIGTDYSPSTIGSKITNSENQPNWFTIDGNMDENEKAFNTAPDRWRVMMGPAGAHMTRSIYPEEVKKVLHAKKGYIDDTNQNDPPENFPGDLGYMYDEWDLGALPKGMHLFYLEYYQPPNYKPGDEVPYLNYFDHPLEVKVGEKKDSNQVIIEPNISKDF